MNIQIFSDIHIEFRKHGVQGIFDFITPIADTAIILGDIDSNDFELTVNAIAEKFKTVIVILGNHDYYNKDISWTPDINILAPNVILLDTDVHEFKDENIVFIGTPLWTDFKDNDWFVINNARLNISDFRCIKNNGCNLHPDDVYSIHLRQKQFLIDQIEFYKNKNKKIIILTHFLPSFDLIAERYKRNNNLSNYYFSANCDDIIEKYNNDILLWCYGHTHIPTDTNIGNIKFICNPLGYPRELSVIDDMILSI